MSAAFFPVLPCFEGFQVDGVFLTGDEVESGWSIASRMMRVLSQRYFGQGPSFRDDFRASFDGVTKQLTIAGRVPFTYAVGAVPALLTGLTSGTGLTSYTGVARPDVVVVEGARLTGPGWSSTSAGVSADGASVGPSRWQTSGITAEVAIGYADAFTAIRTLRGGVWDLVSNDQWLGRLRVTGASLAPQGRLPGVVQVTINATAVP